MHAEEALRTYDIVDTVTEPSRHEGMRVVVRDAGRCFDVVASPSSSYLLPELAGFSLVKREAQLVGTGGILLCGVAVRLEAHSDAILGARRRPSPEAADDWGMVISPRPNPRSIHTKLWTNEPLTFAVFSTPHHGAAGAGGPG